LFLKAWEAAKMGQFQFWHEETYGEISNGRKKTAQGVLDELVRNPSTCRHVKTPQTINPLFCGLTPLSGILPLIRQKKLEIERITGQKTRKDAQILFAAIASYPIEMDLLLDERKGPALFHDLLIWQNLNLGYAQNRFGENLAAIVPHYDENYAHLHVICTPFIRENKLTLGDMHTGQFYGKKAVKEAISENGGLDGLNTKWIYNEAYRAAEHRTQLDYNAQVGVHFGFMIKNGNEKSVRVSSRTEAKALTELKKTRLELERVNSLLAQLQQGKNDSINELATVAEKNVQLLH
jgi:hypothetical protein